MHVVLQYNQFSIDVLNLWAHLDFRDFLIEIWMNLMILNVLMSLFFFNFFEKLCEEQFDFLCCWSMTIVFESCVWRIVSELFSEKLFVILTLVKTSKIIYEIIWFIELWFALWFVFWFVLLSRSLKLKIVFSMNETSISNFFCDALMIAKEIWFEFWVAISNIVSEVSLFICALIIALSFSRILSILFVLIFFALAFAIRMFFIAFSIIFIVHLFAILRWLVEMFSLMIEIVILRLRNKEIDVICESIELMMLWICWIIWSLKSQNVFWFFSLICDIRFNCQSKLTFSADRITNWRCGGMGYVSERTDGE